MNNYCHHHCTTTVTFTVPPSSPSLPYHRHHHCPTIVTITALSSSRTLHYHRQNHCTATITYTFSLSPPFTGSFCIINASSLSPVHHHSNNCSIITWPSSLYTVNLHGNGNSIVTLHITNVYHLLRISCVYLFFPNSLQLVYMGLASFSHVVFSLFTWNDLVCILIVVLFCYCSLCTYFNRQFELD